MLKFFVNSLLSMCEFDVRISCQVARLMAIGSAVIA